MVLLTTVGDWKQNMQMFDSFLSFLQPCKVLRERAALRREAGKISGGVLCPELWG